MSIPYDPYYVHDLQMDGWSENHRVIAVTFHLVALCGKGWLCGDLDETKYNETSK